MKQQKVKFTHQQIQLLVCFQDAMLSCMLVPGLAGSALHMNFSDDDGDDFSADGPSLFGGGAAMSSAVTNAGYNES